MKFNNLRSEDLEKFFETVNKCKGNVYMVSPDMKLNLKSRLVQYVSFAKLCIADKDEIKEIEIETENADDAAILFKLMYEGNA